MGFGVYRFGLLMIVYSGFVFLMVASSHIRFSSGFRSVALLFEASNLDFSSGSMIRRCFVT